MCADIVIDTRTETHRVEILRDSHMPGVYLRISLLIRGEEIPLIDKTFPNSLVASAHLRDAVSLGSAVDILDAHGVPRTDPFFDLNHSDFWDRSPSPEF